MGMEWIGGIVGLAAVVGGYFATRKKSTSLSTEIRERKRLPREDANAWADRIEDWFARLSDHVRIQYALIFIVLVIAVIGLFT